MKSFIQFTEQQDNNEKLLAVIELDIDISDKMSDFSSRRGWEKAGSPESLIGNVLVTHDNKTKEFNVDVIARDYQQDEFLDIVQDIAEYIYKEILNLDIWINKAATTFLTSEDDDDHHDEAIEELKSKLYNAIKKMNSDNIEIRGKKYDKFQDPKNYIKDLKFITV
jgi:hypothetical protein